MSKNIGFEVSDMSVRTASASRFQVDMDIESIDDHSELVELIEDDVVLERAAALGWIDSKDESEVKEADENMGLITDDD